MVASPNEFNTEFDQDALSINSDSTGYSSAEEEETMPPGGQVRIKSSSSSASSSSSFYDYYDYYLVCPSQVTNPMVVVSNRLPFVLVRKEDGSLERRMRYLRFNWSGSELISFSAGGLVTAVAPVVVESQGTWVGSHL